MRKLLGLFIVVGLAIAGSAQQNSAVDSRPSVERLNAHITYLASDKLEGRRTGTPGADAAADYIANEFQRYRLLPGAMQIKTVLSVGPTSLHDGASVTLVYRQEFPYIAGVQLGKGNFAAISKPDGAATSEFRLKEDWTPLGFSSNDRLENLPLTFVGYGLSTPE